METGPTINFVIRVGTQQICTNNRTEKDTSQHPQTVHLLIHVNNYEPDKTKVRLQLFLYLENFFFLLLESRRDLFYLLVRLLLL